MQRSATSRVNRAHGIVYVGAVLVVAVTALSGCTPSKPADCKTLFPLIAQAFNAHLAADQSGTTAGSYSSTMRPWVSKVDDAVARVTDANLKKHADDFSAAFDALVKDSTAAYSDPNGSPARDAVKDQTKLTNAIQLAANVCNITSLNGT